MDTREEWVRMCEKAEEIQTIGRAKATELDDWYYEKATQLFDIGGFAGGECSVWLPRQDQLQKLTGIETIPTLLSQFNEFVFGNVEYTTQEMCNFVNSCEQLWLVFVMKKVYEKIWDGKEWVKR